LGENRAGSEAETWAGVGHDFMPFGMHKVRKFNFIVATPELQE
jgi:hypothetical protein